MEGEEEGGGERGLRKKKVYVAANWMSISKNLFFFFSYFTDGEVGDLLCCCSQVSLYVDDNHLLKHKESGFFLF